MTKSKLLAGLSIAAGLAIAATAVQAQQDAIAKRKEIMKSNGASAKAASDMIKGDRPFDAKIAEESASKIASNLVEFEKLFPKGSEAGETRASPKIWSDSTGFEAKAKEVATSASNASVAAAKGLDSFKAAFGDVGKGCAACHDAYRTPAK